MRSRAWWVVGPGEPWFFLIWRPDNLIFSSSGFSLLSPSEKGTGLARITCTLWSCVWFFPCDLSFVFPKVQMLFCHAMCKVDWKLSPLSHIQGRTTFAETLWLVCSHGQFTRCSACSVPNLSVLQFLQFVGSVLGPISTSHFRQVWAPQPFNNCVIPSCGGWHREIYLGFKESISHLTQTANMERLQ